MRTVLASDRSRGGRSFIVEYCLFWGNTKIPATMDMSSRGVNGGHKPNNILSADGVVVSEGGGVWLSGQQQYCYPQIMCQSSEIEL